MTTEPFIRVISIGGTGMFGMNCLLLESPTTRLLIDSGVMFPADDDLGIDLITPDFTIVENDPPTALLVTHAHEDHIGAIPYLLYALIKHGFKGKLPIYASDFTVAMIKRRLEEHDLTKHVEFNIARPRQTQTFGDITVEFIDVCHSIPGSLAFAFDTPVGKIVHSGDWRIDNTPMAGAKTNLGRFEALGDAGVR
ncbi:MAG: ribonuclease J, partial [Proteobacteria bacterium]|nr:ribonuclease J [Pseudomonadota bacterium]